MAFNYKNYAKTPSDKIMYAWVGESIINPLWVDGAHNPTYSDFNPETYYYYKPTSLALGILGNQWGQSRLILK